MIRAILALSILSSCQPKPVVSDFCKEIDIIGYDRLLTNFSDDELSMINLERKRALLSLKRAYATHCTNKTN